MRLKLQNSNPSALQTPDTWHLTPNTWHTTQTSVFLVFNNLFRLDLILLWFLSTHAERFIVSCMQDFFIMWDFGIHKKNNFYIWLIKCIWHIASLLIKLSLKTLQLSPPISSFKISLSSTYFFYFYCHLGVWNISKTKLVYTF